LAIRVKFVSLEVTGYYRDRYENNFGEFVRAAWPNIDSAPYQDSWAIDAVCDHLEAVMLGALPPLDMKHEADQIGGCCAWFSGTAR
jgi:hypothetical protein